MRTHTKSRIDGCQDLLCQVERRNLTYEDFHGENVMGEYDVRFKSGT
jgi:hypothetical protein